MCDMVGLLLMIRINYQHRLLMNKRRIPCLDDYLDRVNLQLWPRFKVPANGLNPASSSDG
jgi:vacuolar protein sorting-associated protein 52